jgi:hypothetical protein
MERVPNVGRLHILMKEVQPPPEKLEKLKVKKGPLFLTDAELISANGVAVTFEIFLLCCKICC